MSSKGRHADVESETLLAKKETETSTKRLVGATAAASFVLGLIAATAVLSPLIRRRATPLAATTKASENPRHSSRRPSLISHSVRSLFIATKPTPTATSATM